EAVQVERLVAGDHPVRPRPPLVPRPALEEAGGAVPVVDVVVVAERDRRIVVVPQPHTVVASSVMRLHRPPAAAEGREGADAEADPPDAVRVFTGHRPAVP